MAYQIRTAQIEDSAALADLLREIGYFSLVLKETPEETQERVRREMELCLRDDSHSLWVAEREDGMVQGYVSVHWLPYLIHRGPEAYVSELFVLSTARGQGIGSALLETAVAEARRRGCGRMMLLNIRDRESYQRGFYKKHGWEEREDAANFILRL